MTLAKKIVLLLMAAGMLLAVFLESVPASSEEMKHDMSKMGMGAQSPATTGYEAAMKKMHKDMAIKYSGNADVDFVRGMIPHHQGAIDMAQLELAYGEDARLRRLAEEIIVTQQQEIAVMRLVLQDIAAGRAAPDDGQHAMQMTGTHAMDGMKMDMPPAMHGTADQGATAP